MVLKPALGLEYLLLNWTKKTVDALFIHNKRPAVGSVVYCNLGLAFEHTGICVDGEHMVHLSGRGVVEMVDAKEFCGRLKGANPSFTIFCPVQKGKAVGDEEVARRALSLVGQHKKYNLVLSNCHCFSAYCLTGQEVFCPSFTELELFLQREYPGYTWRATNLLR